MSPLKYGALLSLASVSVFRGAISLKPGDSIRDFGKALSTVELDELKARVEKFLREAGKRIVVLIDDIDRLDREEIQAIFKLVKLSAGFENVSYVLAFDDEVVAAALGQRYGAGDATAGRNFLEKIIQVPLALPPADKLALRQLTFEGVDATLHQIQLRLSESDVQAFARHFVDGLECRLATPRQAKRYVNALTFSMPVLKGEVHPIDQMLIEGIRVFYPKLYDVIRDNPDVVLGSNPSRRDNAEWRKSSLATLEPGFAGLVGAELDAAQDVLQVLFPRLKAVFGNCHYGDEWDERWQREQRICSDAYFVRYFHYGIPPRDISDEAIEEILTTSSNSSEDAARLITSHCKKGTASILIRKLRSREKTIPVGAIKGLAMAVAISGAAFPRERSMYSFVASTIAQAGILVSNLVKLLPPGAEREQLAGELISVADPIPFAIECFNWMRSDPSAPDRLLAPECEGRLGRIMAGRIEAAAREYPPYQAWPEETSMILTLWKQYGSNGAVQQYLQERFSSDKHEVLLLLDAFTPTAWGLESGLSHKADFMQQGYDAVAQLISPDLVMGHLRKLYGAAVDAADFCQTQDIPAEERIARQFGFLHRRAQQRSREVPDNAAMRVDSADFAAASGEPGAGQTVS